MLLEQMLKRQDSLLSSSRRETPPPSSQKHHAATTTSVGCMSGIFHLITKYQNRNKRLTTGRKHNKSTNSSSSTCSSPKRANKVSRTTQTSPSSKGHDINKHAKTSTRSPSSNVVVSKNPPLRQENRGSKVHRNQPTLVARLMGLEEIPGNYSPCNKVVVMKKEGCDEEKRRKLLLALERCNDDLATLKKVIKAVQVVDKRAVPPETVELGGEAWGESDHQRLSRACVIDQRFRSPMATSNGVEASPPCRVEMTRKKPWQEDGIETYFFRKSLAKAWDINREILSPSSKHSSSKAMIQSVDQVCRDIAWGEKREEGIIGLMLQECLWKDLIEEIVQEMIGCWIYVLPFEACKRRLFS